MKKILIVLVIGAFLFSCATRDNENLSRIYSPQVLTINAPAAGNYPQGLYKYPFKIVTWSATRPLITEAFTQTIEWSPKVPKTFDTNTQYTAKIILEPVNKQDTFEGTSIDDIIGLPTEGVENITLNINRRNLEIQILFETTANEKAPAQILFYDNFDGDALDTSKWNLCPEWDDRQQRSSWRDDMVSVSDGFLRLRFMRDTELGRQKTNDTSLSDNWLRSGAVRTQTKNYQLIFDNTYGYYEARIKFPVVRGTWGAFWLMSPTQQFITGNGIIGTEIDIVESIHNERGRYNAAYHWDGYGPHTNSVGSSATAALPVDIYDGEFHVFSLAWSPTEYIFYVNGIEFWRSDGGPDFKNSGINQNPNYIKFSVEGAAWAGSLPADFVEGEMLVDYVRVYNQPRI
jgi:beta-glucanase (GH16 family)